MATNNATNTSNPIIVSQGGTGLSTATTAYGVVCAGTTATGALQVLNALGSSGQVLTSNGASALPTWQAASASAGQVLQVLSGTLTSTASSSSSTFADTGLTVSITPSSSSNKVLVIAYVCTSNDAGTTNNSTFLNLVRGSTNIFVGDSAGNRIQVTAFPAPSAAASLSLMCATMMYLDSPATTSSTTYKVQFAASNNAATVYINRSYTDTNATTVGRAASSIVVMEVKG